jgi:tetratricopeptide (TPR) repeat protein
MQVYNSSGSRIIIIVFVISLFWSKGTTNAQILQDTSSVKQLKQGIDYIYNSQFGLAEEVLTTINSKYPGHPVTFLFKGLLINWENYPLLPFSHERKSFESQLHASIRLSEAEDGWSDDPEKLLISLCSRSLLMLLYSENEMSSDLIPWVHGTYRCIRKAFEYNSVYADLCYFTGLYNYYREAYPEQHPIYKAVAFLFPRGDKEKGLEELQKAAENAIVLGPEAYSILSWICIQYENDFPRALDYSKTVFDRYPVNPWFRAEYLKNLFLIREYDEAEQIILSSADEENAYFSCQMAIFQGLLQEKKYNDYELAEKFYERGITGLEYYGARGKTFLDFGQEGLKRIEDLREGKRPERKRKHKDSGFFNVSFDE